MIETQDHDQGQPPLRVGRIGALALVLLDGRRWLLTPSGDPLADRLVADFTPNKKPATVTTRDGLNLVSSTTPLTLTKDNGNECIHGTGPRV